MGETVIEILLWLVAILVATPALVFSAEVALSLLACANRPRIDKHEDQARYVVLVPAHNEELLLPDTLRALLREDCQPQDIVVIADNCTDTTAQIARSAGVTVVERHDQQRIGKGYALEAGLAAVDRSQTDVLIVLDADTTVAKGSLRQLANTAFQDDGPTQSVYLMQQPDEQAKSPISELAVIFKNLVRPVGLSMMGGPCPLTGSGMAIPVHLLDRVALGTGNLVEDMKLGVDLALLGHPPKLCPGVVVSGPLSPETNANTAQRRRWEQGHLHTMITQAPRLIAAGVARFDPRLCLMGIDQLVPPLSLLVLLWGVTTMLCAIAGLFGIIGPAILMLSIGLLLTLSIVAGWFRYARNTISFSQLLSVPVYFLQKVPMYLGFVRRRETGWVRTIRHADGGDASLQKD